MLPALAFIYVWVMPKHIEFALDLASFHYSLSFYPINFEPWQNDTEVLMLWLFAISVSF